MMGHILRTYMRSLQRHKLIAAMNVMGLGLGLAVFLLLMLFVRFETSFERWLPESDRIYAVRQSWTFPGTPPEQSFSTMGGLLDVIRQDHSGTVGTRAMDSTATIRSGGLFVEEPIRAVDPNFLQIFRFPLSAGTQASALARPDSLVISERLARKYLGSARPLGRPLTMSIDGVERTLVVTGVLRPMPSRTEVESELLIRLDPARYDDKVFRNWGSSILKTFLRFETPEDARALERQLDGLIRRRAVKDIGPMAGDELHLQLVPLRSVHLIEPEDQATVAAVALVALLTLLVACINYVNLDTARGARRAREVAIRKVVGATRSMLIGQFLFESVLTVALAGAVGLSLAELFLPFMNAAAGTQLSIDYTGPDGVVLPLILVILFVGLLAGIYPALLLSRYIPAQVLASSRAPGGGRRGTRIRTALVVAQFAIAIAFMVATAVVFAQTAFLRTADLGFGRNGLLIVPSLQNALLDDAQRSAIVARFRAIPGVVSVTWSDAAPGAGSITKAAGVGRPGLTTRKPTLSQVRIGTDFFTTYAARLLAGRTLSARFGLDDATPVSPGAGVPTGADPVARSTVLNRSAVATLGFASPRAAIGQRIVMDVEGGQLPLTIVGVIDDMRFASLRGRVSPTLYLLQSRGISSPIATLRYADTATAAAGASAAQSAWRAIAPQVPFEALTVERSLAAFYVADDQRSRLFLAGAVMAVLISCLGLYGLATFTTAQRTKEIGIRKALGADRHDILLLIGGQFLRPVILANLIAWPLAYLAMRSWLDGFDRRIAMQPGFFLGAAAIAILVAGVTVLTTVLKVTRAEPAWALRHD